MWVINQRVLWKNGALSDEKIALLDRIGFNWSPKAHTWRSHYLALIAYREKHGDCRVPQQWAENKRLATWVGTQRTRYKRGVLSDEKIQMLNRIGFDWVVGLGTWEDRFQEVCAYKAEHQNCRVPTRWKQNPPLASWVVDQRYDRRKGKLRPDYEQKLTEIGFEWEVPGGIARATGWKEKLNALIACKSERGHFPFHAETRRTTASRVGFTGKVASA
jgi:hypothetical protein